MDKIGGKSGLQKKMVKNCENSVFRVIFVKKKKKRFARVGTIFRDGRVTGNKHIFFLGLSNTPFKATPSGHHCNRFSESNNRDLMY